MQDPQKVLQADRKLDDIRATLSIAEQIRQQTAKTGETSDSEPEKASLQQKSSQDPSKKAAQKPGMRQQQIVDKHVHPVSTIRPGKRKPAIAGAWASAKAFAQPDNAVSGEAKSSLVRKPLVPVNAQEGLQGICQLSFLSSECEDPRENLHCATPL